MSTTEEVVEEARELFRQGDYSAALPKFKKCSTQGDAAFRTRMHNNIAICCLKLGQLEEAASSAQRVLDQEPANQKAHFRLASAIQDDDDVMKALQHAMLPAGLMRQSKQSDASVEDLFKRVHVRAMQFQKQQQAQVAAVKADSPGGNPAKHLAPIVPKSIDHIHVVSTSKEFNKLSRVVMTSHDQHVVFILPGTYTNLLQLLHLSKAQVWFIGVGNVELDVPMMHLYWLQNKEGVAMWQGVQLSRKNGQQCGMAAMCCAPGTLTLLDCCFRGLPDSCVLAASEGAHIHANRCKFERIGFMTFEIREGGVAYINDVTIKKAKQGVLCYAGAKRVDVLNTHIEDTDKEAIYVDGNQKTASMQAAERMFSEKMQKTEAQTIAQVASDLANKMGLSGKLAVSVHYCTMLRAGTLGLSCCSGATVYAKGCSFQNNKMAGVYVAGGADVVLQSNVFSDHKLSGVHVEANFDSDVVVRDCQFYKNKTDVLDSLGARTKNRNPMMMKQIKALGLHGKAPLLEGKVVAADKGSVWTVAKLKQRLETDDTTDSVEDIVRQRQQATLLCQTHPQLPNRTRMPSPAKLCYQDSEHLYYAIGNTKGFDLLKGRWGDADVAKGGEADTWNVLLGAAGDIRNVVETVAGWARAGGGKALKLVLNDANASMVARDLALLEIARGGAQGVDTLLNTWSSLGISSQHKSELEEAIKKLYNAIARVTGGLLWKGTEPSSRDSSDGAYCFVDFENSSVASLKALLPVLEAWLGCQLKLENVQDDWSRFVMGQLKDGAKSLAETALKDDADKPVNYLVKKQIVRYTNTLCYSTEADLQLNPTFLKVPGMSIVDTSFSSSIYRAVERFNVKAYLEEILPLLQDAFNSGKVSIQVVLGDIFDLVQQPESKYTDYIARKQRLFDAADFTNVGDYVGLGNVLAVASNLTSCAHVQIMRSLKDIPDVATAHKSLLADLGVESLDIFTQLSGATLTQYSLKGKTGETRTFFTTWTFAAQDQDIPLLTPEQIVQVSKIYCQKIGKYKVTGTHRLSAVSLGFFRWGVYVKDPSTIAALRAKYPFYSDVFDSFHRECVLYECSTFVDYQRILGWSMGDSASVVAAVFDMDALKKSKHYHKILPMFPSLDDYNQELRHYSFDDLQQVAMSHVLGHKKNSSEVQKPLQLVSQAIARKAKQDRGGYLIPQDSSFIVSLIPMVDCDYNQGKAYLLFPGVLEEKYDGDRHSVVFLQERKNGFMPIAQPQPVDLFWEYAGSTD